MTQIRPEIFKDDVVPSLWKRYTSSYEYRVEHRTESINSSHELVKTAEKQGLNKLVIQFIAKLRERQNIRDEYQARDRHAWVKEWQEMHKLLFKYVYKVRGRLRINGQDVRFGTPGDEDRHHIPLGGTAVSLELYEYAANIGVQLSYVNGGSIEDVCGFLARVHYGFIRIHPFIDGNGRVARALTDQLAVSLGYPPVIAAYPRLDSIAKQLYHDAITGCIDDPECRTLKYWIKNKIDASLDKIA
jgi:Fic family protein